MTIAVCVCVYSHKVLGVCVCVQEKYRKCTLQLTLKQVGSHFDFYDQ